MSSKLVREILKTTKTLDALCAEYLSGEGTERLRAGIEVNRHGPLNKLKVEIIKGLPSLRLDKFHDARRARGIA